MAVVPRIFASVGGSLIVGGFGLQIMDFLGKGDAQKGFSYFAYIITAVFIITIYGHKCKISGSCKSSEGREDIL